MAGVEAATDIYRRHFLSGRNALLLEYTVARCGGDYVIDAPRDSAGGGRPPYRVPGGQRRGDRLRATVAGEPVPEGPALDGVAHAIEQFEEAGVWRVAGRLVYVTPHDVLLHAPKGSGVDLQWWREHYGSLEEVAPGWYYYVEEHPPDCG